MGISSYFAGAAMIGALAVTPVAHAKIVDQSDAGFTVAHTAQVAATPADAWKMLRMPESWWSKDHSWSGDAANFWLDSQAGGCFCEKLPPAKPGGAPGSVQHARILFAKPDEMMRLSGAFGPLQGEAVVGTLTIQIKPTSTGSAIRFDYTVGGYMRFKVADVAPGVDRVLGEQLVGLAKALGGSLPVARGETDGAAKEAPPKDEQGLDAAVADLVKDEPKETPESD